MEGFFEFFFEFMITSALIIFGIVLLGIVVLGSWAKAKLDIFDVCPKCGGKESYASKVQEMRGFGLSLHAAYRNVQLCRKCDVEMVTTSRKKSS